MTKDNSAQVAQIFNIIRDQRDAARALLDEALEDRNLAQRAAEELRHDLTMLDDAIAERDALRERCVEWLPFTDDAQKVQGSILVWREDAGVFVAFYDEEQECWFSERGEDLTGDLPAFYARMPKGPSE